MTITPQLIASRLQFSSQLLAELANGIEANALALPDSADARQMAATAREIRKIGCVQQQIATRLQTKHGTSSKQQIKAPKGTHPEALHAS